ncbi:MAG TPA: hypothetical protein VLV45_00350 [Gemmatimonadales bacterium]|nr:hypothetical protein [Gemmatimonadales bacterium]
MRSPAGVSAVRVLSGAMYLRSLRVLGAWWCRGSSGVGPHHLLLGQDFEPVAIPIEASRSDAARSDLPRL